MGRTTNGSGQQLIFPLSVGLFNEARLRSLRSQVNLHIVEIINGIIAEAKLNSIRSLSKLMNMIRKLRVRLSLFISQVNLYA